MSHPAKDSVGGMVFSGKQVGRWIAAASAASSRVRPGPAITRQGSQAQLSCGNNRAITIRNAMNNAAQAATQEMKILTKTSADIGAGIDIEGVCAGFRARGQAITHIIENTK